MMDFVIDKPRMSASPYTGSALPDYDTYGDAAAAAVHLMLDIYVPTPAQESLIHKLNAIRKSCIGIRGIPLPGRGLSQLSNAGKSKTISEFARRANSEAPENPHRVLHIQLTERITLKMLYQRILARLGDPEALGRYSIEDLRQRCAELMPALGTELLAIDEVQLLTKGTKDNYDVADGLKELLDAGVVPVLFAGTEKAKSLFEVNEQLRPRLGPPLLLNPSNPKLTADRRALKNFAHDLDERLAASALVGLSGFASDGVWNKIGKASGGHVGRFCRIVEMALEHACARGADHVEIYDLSFAVAHVAIPARWVAKNPFPEPEEW